MTEKKKRKVEIVVAKKTPEEFISEEVFNDILQWITDGNTLRSYCRQAGAPGWMSVYNHINRSEERRDRYRKAREAGMDAIAEDTIAMVDEYPEKIQGDRVDPGWVNWRRIQVEQRLRLLAKWDPKRYGDKVGIDHSGGVNLNVITGVPTEIPYEDTKELPE